MTIANAAFVADRRVAIRQRMRSAGNAETANDAQSSHIVLSGQHFHRIGKTSPSSSTYVFWHRLQCDTKHQGSGNMTTNPPYDNCRRRVPRIPLPCELELTIGDRRVHAMIRDVSIGGESTLGFIGIGLLHTEALPLQTEIHCHCKTKTSLIHQYSTVTLVWSRHFGADGYLSGGRMVHAAVENPDTDATSTAPDTAPFEQQLHR
jgi:hypothetical protein